VYTKIMASQFELQATAVKLPEVRKPRSFAHRVEKIFHSVRRVANESFAGPNDQRCTRKIPMVIGCPVIRSARNGWRWHRDASDESIKSPTATGCGQEVSRPVLIAIKVSGPPVRTWDIRRAISE